MKNSKYKITIGLEVHVHLKTRTKLFCRCPNLYGSDPNTLICPVCTGQPGTLPVAGRESVRQAVSAALALNCNINEYSIFERKQYFYPDLPKNYQISQYKLPLAENGYIKAGGVKIKIDRVHMEEDAGKLVHREKETLVDYNRGGAPLIEIVSAPEITSPPQAAEYLKKLRQILIYASVSDCDMEKGSMRCDANLSLNLKESSRLGVKTEVKNMNSFKAVENALAYEARRQESLLLEGKNIVQETRLWDEDKNKTAGMRTKEEAHDYRYFPDPDLPPLIVAEAFVEDIRESLPELPAAKMERYIKEMGLEEYDASVLCQERDGADFFESAYEKLEDKKEGIKKLSSWISTELKGKMNAAGLDFKSLEMGPSFLAELVNLIQNGKISGKMAKDIFEIIWTEKRSPAEIVEEKGLSQISGEDKIERLCRKAIEENPALTDKYLSGKEGTIGPLVGFVMKESRGQANPSMVNKKLREILNEKK